MCTVVICVNYKFATKSWFCSSLSLITITYHFSLFTFITSLTTYLPSVMLSYSV